MREIKIPLIMKDGVKVRTIEKLRENFDAESLLINYMNKKLIKWLSNRGYIEFTNEVSKLNPDDKHIITKLCGVLKIESNLTEEQEITIIKKVKKKIDVKKYTEDDRILNNIESVALNQDEFNKLLTSPIEKIYVAGDKFTLNDCTGSKTIEGLNKPIIWIGMNQEGLTNRAIQFINVDVRIDDVTRIVSDMGIAFGSTLKRAIERLRDNELSDKSTGPTGKPVIQSLNPSKQSGPTGKPVIQSLNSSKQSGPTGKPVIQSLNPSKQSGPTGKPVTQSLNAGKLSGKPINNTYNIKEYKN